jgi:hypothetical protein
MITGQYEQCIAGNIHHNVCNMIDIQAHQPPKESSLTCSPSNVENSSQPVSPSCYFFTTLSQGFSLN